MKISILLSSILLLPVIFCNSDHKDHDDPNWIKYLPNHVAQILKSRTTTTTERNEESSFSNQESNSTESLSPGKARNSSVTPELMHDYGDQPSSRNSQKIGEIFITVFIIIIILTLPFICYCFYRNCRNSETISQGIVVQQPLQPPPHDPNPSHIVVQPIHGQPPHMVQPQPQFQQVPPQFQHAPPNQQFQQQPPPYPTGYETQQMLQQEWSPHAPMNQSQQYPAPDYPYNPSAPPPSYGKY